VKLTGEIIRLSHTRVTRIHGGKKKGKMGSVEILSLSILLKKGYEGDPLSPPEGEAAQGEHLLTPSLYLSRFKKRISRQPPESYRIFHGCISGAELKVAAAQKSVRTIFP
jgi:hypothetical protein